jgi:hypothetical protein
MTLKSGLGSVVTAHLCLGNVSEAVSTEAGGSTSEMASWYWLPILLCSGLDTKSPTKGSCIEGLVLSR